MYMNDRMLCSRIVIFVLALLCLYSCGQNPPLQEKDIVKNPVQLAKHISGDLKSLLLEACSQGGRLNDSVTLRYCRLDSAFYEGRNNQSLWSEHGRWLPMGDSLYDFIRNSKEYGLFPEDYHYKAISFIHRALADSFARNNAVLWTRADILLTDAFFGLVKDVKQGRLAFDSVTLRTDSILPDSFFIRNLEAAVQSGSVKTAMDSLEPRYAGYDSLRQYLGSFLRTARFKPFTYLFYPYGDSVEFFRLLQKRLHEISLVASDSAAMDTSAMTKAIRKYQKEKGLKPTGRISEAMVDMLNNTDLLKFKRIALTLDRYKLLPDTLPHTYLWVNLPSFYLQVINSDTIVFESKIIVGAPKTRTPLLTSEISNFVTLPQWTVPYSIIFKEMLPKIQKNIDFLKKENLMVVDQDDNVVDPSKIKWSKLSKNHFPYQLKQQQGDNNSLGVIKFNFRNKYSVYMHDTNVRGKFAQAFRALSHGCVRVKEWEKLSDFLIRNDTIRYKPDTLRAWIKRQEKHTVSGFQRLPVYIRYFGCAGKNGQIRFYEDIYGEDKVLLEKYFADKTVN